MVGLVGLVGWWDGGVGGWDQQKIKPRWVRPSDLQTFCQTPNAFSCACSTASQVRASWHLIFINWNARLQWHCWFFNEGDVGFIKFCTSLWWDFLRYQNRWSLENLQESMRICGFIIIRRNGNVAVNILSRHVHNDLCIITWSRIKIYQRIDQHHQHWKHWIWGVSTVTLSNTYITWVISLRIIAYHSISFNHCHDRASAFRTCHHW